MSDNVKEVPVVVKKLDKVVSVIELILVILASLSLILMLAVITYSIFARQMGWPTIWTNELASYLMLYTAFLAAPWILSKDEHVRVDLLLNILKGKMLRINNIFIGVVSSIALAIFFWYAATITLDNYQKGTQLASTVEWPQYILLLPIPIGIFFVLVRFIISIFKPLVVEE